MRDPSAPTQHIDVFKEPIGLPPTRKDGGIRIQTIPGTEPPHRSPYRLTPEEWEVYKDSTRVLLSGRLVRGSSWPYAAAVNFVPLGFDDEGTSKMRMCIDNCALNKIALKDRFPLPYPEDLITMLHGMNRFTSLDFWSGFPQHRCHQDTIEKTAFIGPDALYEWLVMPFGAANAPSESMRLMADLLIEHTDKGYCIVFFDDILIYSKNIEDHERHVKAVM